jgi:hypothetical protein
MLAQEMNKTALAGLQMRGASPEQCSTVGGMRTSAEPLTRNNYTNRLEEAGFRVGGGKTHARCANLELISRIARAPRSTKCVWKYERHVRETPADPDLFVCCVLKPVMR